MHLSLIKNNLVTKRWLLMALMSLLMFAVQRSMAAGFRTWLPLAFGASAVCYLLGATVVRMTQIRAFGLTRTDFLGCNGLILAGVCAVGLLAQWGMFNARWCLVELLLVGAWVGLFLWRELVIREGTGSRNVELLSGLNLSRGSVSLTENLVALAVVSVVVLPLAWWSDNVYVWTLLPFALALAAGDFLRGLDLHGWLAFGLTRRMWQRRELGLLAAGLIPLIPVTVVHGVGIGLLAFSVYAVLIVSTAVPVGNGLAVFAVVWMAFGIRSEGPQWLLVSVALIVLARATYEVFVRIPKVEKPA